MKTHLKNRFLLPVLVAALGSLLMAQVSAQTFTTLHSFTGGSGGSLPLATLILSGNTLYGTSTGGSFGNSTLFRVNIDGTGFANVHNFTGSVDGDRPGSRLIVSGSTVYGTAGSGSISGNGSVFAVNTDGTAFTDLYRFNGGNDGTGPSADLILSGNTLYGTAGGGASASGLLFGINTDGTGFAPRYTFTGTSEGVNSDGANPSALLLLSGATLYGTATWGGDSGNGTVFKVNTDGTGFTILHSFTASSTSPPFGNSDGTAPVGGLSLSGNKLCGTTLYGGSSAQGTVFTINTDGTGFRNLHSFTGGSDGGQPEGGVISSGTMLYGTTHQGGSSGSGTVFAVNADGLDFTVLHTFTPRSGPPYQTNSDGAIPSAGLILSGTTLYGTARFGGSSGYGTVFSLSFRPQLAIIPSGANVILTWPTNYAGFDYTGYTLQSTTNLGASEIWTTNSPAPVVVNGQNTVTNLISGTPQFFRLIQ